MSLQVPVDETITLDALTVDPYPIYKRLRAEAPVIKVKAAGRILLTKAADTKYVKDNPELFSSNDPQTPMKRAFRAHTLMRKDGAEHLAERNAMMPTFAPRHIRDVWMPLFRDLAERYVDRLPKGEVIDLFEALSAPFCAQCLSHLMGLPDVPDADMARWSQTLIDGAGNFGWRDEPFARSDAANDEMDAEFARMIPYHREAPNPSALSVMVNADDPIPMSQIYSNVKIAIGGGINEPRDALNTVLFGLLTNPEQFEALKDDPSLSGQAFEEAVRWVAPIQASSRLATEDTEIRGFGIAKGETVMTIQASANRDEEIWGEAEDFDMFRANGQHQAFGNGPHFCMGTHIARRQIGQIMLPMLVERFPNMRLPDPSAVKFRGFGFRGPINLPIILE